MAEEQYSILYRYHIFFKSIHPVMGIGDVSIFAIINNASVNMGAHVLVNARFHFLGYLARSGNAELYGKSFLNL